MKKRNFSSRVATVLLLTVVLPFLFSSRCSADADESFNPIFDRRAAVITANNKDHDAAASSPLGMHSHKYNEEDHPLSSLAAERRDLVSVSCQEHSIFVLQSFFTNHLHAHVFFDFPRFIDCRIEGEATAEASRQHSIQEEASTRGFSSSVYWSEIKQSTKTK